MEAGGGTYGVVVGRESIALSIRMLVISEIVKKRVKISIGRTDKVGCKTQRRVSKEKGLAHQQANRGHGVRSGWKRGRESCRQR